jgi:hypothetical protein
MKALMKSEHGQFYAATDQGPAKKTGSTKLPTKFVIGSLANANQAYILFVITRPKLASGSIQMLYHSGIESRLSL